jgi:hypothetical protein
MLNDEGQAAGAGVEGMDVFGTSLLELRWAPQRMRWKDTLHGRE